MPASKDVSVTLRIDGVDQEEYGSSTLTDGSVQCHVASQEGKVSLCIIDWEPSYRAPGVLPPCGKQPTGYATILQGVR